MLIAVAVVGFLVFNHGIVKNPFVPKSERLYEEYDAHLKTLNSRRFMEEPVYRWDYQEKSKKLRKQVIDAAMKEENANRAIPLIESVIEDLERPAVVIDREIPISAAQVRLRALYYERLARAHEMNDNIRAKDAAFKKAAALEARTAKMK